MDLTKNDQRVSGSQQVNFFDPTQEAPWQTVKLSEPPKPSLTSLRGHRNLSLSEPKVI